MLYLGFLVSFGRRTSVVVSCHVRGARKHVYLRNEWFCLSSFLIATLLWYDCYAEKVRRGLVTDRGLWFVGTLPSFQQLQQHELQLPRSRNNRCE